jgi:hypothetical protein
MGTEADEGDRELAELMGKLEQPAFLAGIGRPLTSGEGVSRSTSPAPPAGASPDGGGCSERRTIADAVRTVGWCSLPAVVAPDEARRLVEVIDHLGAEGLPPLFVYAFDATWDVGARIARTLSAALAMPYVVIADAWAFRVAPGPEHAGWSPHRGTYELAPDRGAPDHINVWVALTDATIDNACMHVVPLDEDAGYPGDLRSHAAAERARPLPVPAGTALFWNSNVLHSGGRSSDRAAAPRISLTFTLRRADLAGVDASHPAAIDDLGCDHRARLDLIADQIATYGQLERTLPDVVRRWARMTVNLRDLFASGHSSEPRKAL